MNANDELRDGQASSLSEWDQADASEKGARNPERAWILSDRDVWYRNPYYSGPRVPHPEEANQ